MKYCLAFLFLVSTLDGSSTPEVYEYRIYCITEGQNVYEWNTVMPTTCPNNTAHVINPNSISIVDQQSPALITIKEETTPTGGHYRTESRKIIAATGPNVATTMQYSWPFDISVLAIYFTTTSDLEGDILTVETPSQMIFGTISQDVAEGVVSIPVTSSVTSNVYVGYYITLYDGVNTNNLGRIIGIDLVNNILTVETATANAFAAATPTYVQISIRPIDTFEFGPPMSYVFGVKKIGGSYLPANTVVNVNYLNNSDTQKTLVIGYEYLY